MAGFCIATVLAPMHGLTEEEQREVLSIVAEAMCGMTPYKNWCEAAISYCKGFQKQRKEERQ